MTNDESEAINVHNRQKENAKTNKKKKKKKKNPLRNSEYPRRAEKLSVKYDHYGTILQSKNLPF